MEITIRPAVQADYGAAERMMEQVHAMHVQWRPDVYCPVSPVLSPEQFEEDVRLGRTVIAELDGAAAGLMSFFERHIAGGPGRTSYDVLFVDTTVVDERFRGRGVGRALLEYAAALAKARGLRSVELQVNARNDGAREMYERCGFREKSVNMELALS